MLKELLQVPDWRTQLLACSDSYAVGCALVACSQVMLPFWDAHSMTDDGFGKAVSAMVEWVARPSDESRAGVAVCLAAIAVVRVPDRREHTYLSMPRDEWWPPWPEPNVNTAPGEHAANSIVSAANYVCEIDKPHAPQCSVACLDSALTAISHAFGERIHEDTEADIWVLAVDRLRLEILKHLRFQSLRGGK